MPGLHPSLPDLHVLRWDDKPVETLARAAAREAWAQHGEQAPRRPALPAWLALERLVAEAQLDGADVEPGDRVSVMVEALLAQRDEWDELASAARRSFLAAHQAELEELADVEEEIAAQRVAQKENV